MKKHLKCMGAMLLALVLVFSLAACGGGKKADSTQNPSDTSASAEASGALTGTDADSAGNPSDASAPEEETNTLTGTIDEIKDFMFIVEADDGNPYAFPYDSSNKPEGLADVSEGDSVVITYTGELSVVDNFTGKIISIEPAEES